MDRLCYNTTSSKPIEKDWANLGLFLSPQNGLEISLPTRETFLSVCLNARR
jgi:hypothetical protein